MKSRMFSGLEREHAAFDRTERLPESLCELGLCETSEVRQFDRFALLIGQLPQRVTYAVALKAKPDRLVRAVVTLLLALRQLLGAPALVGTDEIDGPPMHQR